MIRHVSGPRHVEWSVRISRTLCSQEHNVREIRLHSSEGGAPGTTVHPYTYMPSREGAVVHSSKAFLSRSF